MSNPVVLRALIGIWIFLCVASVIVAALVRFSPQKNFSELATWTKSWWVMLAVFTAAMLTNRIVSICFLGCISFLALKEFFSMIPTRRADRRVLFWAYLSIPIQFYWVAIQWYGMFIIFIPIYMFLLIAFRMVMTQKTEGFLKAAGTIHWTLMTAVFAVSHMAYLLTLPSSPMIPAGGPGLLLFLVLLTQLNDVAQYVWGRLFGKHAILPAISPKKTWEGFIGGLMTTPLVALCVSPFLTPFDSGTALLAGLLIAVAGFLGDVTISAIKRDIGVKDTGALIPGHGGIMDRIDSLTCAAPLFFHLTWYLYGY